MYNKAPVSKYKGGLSVGVPGELKGLHLAWQHHGRLEWTELVEPSIALAHAFVVQPYLAYHIQEEISDILTDNGLRETFVPGGKPLVVGDICFRKNLAKTLEKIAKHGPEAIYSGPIAERIVEDVKAAGGILTLEDLRDYKVEIRKPVIAETMGYTVIGMPPPSSGGPSLVLVSYHAQHRTVEIKIIASLVTHLTFGHHSLKYGAPSVIFRMALTDCCVGGRFSTFWRSMVQLRQSRACWGCTASLKLLSIHTLCE